MMRFTGFFGSLVCVVACNAPAPGRTASVSAEPGPLARATALAPVPVAVTALPAVKADIATPSVAGARGTPAKATTSALQLKRLVVTTGVKDREPVAGGEALPSDGRPIYAFAELANVAGQSENVRVTFERKGGAERVGNVTLPVPGNVPRHRTWAMTHFIRAAGVWEAVLWSEAGSELGRTSFEVGPA